MAKRRPRKYLVGTPRPGPNAQLVVQHWATAVRQFGPLMAQNYLRGITAVATNPQMLQQMAAKLAEWYAIFFGRNVPAEYMRIMEPVRAEYRLRRYQIERQVAAAAPVAPAVPAPAAPAPAPAAPRVVAPPPVVG